MIDKKTKQRLIIKLISYIINFTMKHYLNIYVFIIVHYVASFGTHITLNLILI